MGKSKKISLRWLLLSSILGVTILFWLISIGIILGVTWKETNKTYDYNLRESAHLLFHMARNQEDYSPRWRSDREDLDDELETKRLYYQVIRNDEVVMYSRKGSKIPFVNGFDEKRGFRNVWVNEQEWRVFIIRGKHGQLEVQVAQSMKQRQKLLWEMIEDLGLHALVLLGILTAVSSAIIYFLLKPLVNITKQISEKDANHLDVLPNQYRIKELNEIVTSLNGLLASLNHALVAERQFTSNAAHELRTHLSRLDMKVQLLQRKRPALIDDLVDIRTEIKRYTKMVSNLLILARLDPIAGNIEEHIHFSEVNLSQLIKRIVYSFDADIVDKNMHIQVDVPHHDIILQSSEELLSIMISNVLENAIKYCEPQSKIHLHLYEDVKNIYLTLADTGQGVSDEVLSQLTQRFYRVLGTQVDGSGLGLSMVNEIVKVLGWKLEIVSGSQYQGMKFNFMLPKKFVN